ncbi:UDP-glucose:glycoprotein glucosyltransferase [Portunus trituberculatus]|uniref:UDP-glucose:glycoprotein glucosyltransferase n=1 Tax=Portunus trituberculatus TaxID=210409 RepID=A0A5B7E954_PORTR|nr:UDP-glucose:glycoprotein glucosyltransferase [Portunus trituberculatus]
MKGLKCKGFTRMGGTAFWAIVALCALILLFGEVSGQAKSKPITTHLTAKWPDSPLLLEASEYMAEESLATFWGFVETIAEMDVNAYREKTDKEKFEDTLMTASRFLLPSQLRILKFALSVRAYSPKIEMFRQIVIDRSLPSPVECGAVVDVGGQLVCDVDKVKKLVEEGGGDKPVVYEVDHHFPGGENAKVVAVLYAELGSPEFPAFHQMLKELASAGKVDYILRHRVQNHSPRRVRLSGYGVELAIKSTEYKAQDDTKVQEEDREVVEDEEGEVEVEGFLFNKLESLHPEKKEDLNQLRKHLIESQHEMAPMKVWQLQHLSLQAAQRIMSAPPDQQLSILVQTAQNFPALARSLVRIKVDDKMKREILKNQNTLSQQMDVNPSDAALFINGLLLDMEYTTIFTLLDHIRSEDRVIGGLHKLGLEGEALTTLLALDASDGPQEYGIDIRDSAIMWMNNIETDKAYRKWPSSTGELLRPTYPGMLRSIRKNFHNLVIVADPSKASTAELIRLVESFMNHNAPFRIGLVIAVDSDESLRGFDDAGLAMLCAFNFISENFAGREDANLKALQFMIDIYGSSQGDITVADITNFFANKYPSTDLDDVFGEDSDYDVGRMLAQEFVEKAGITTFPQVLMNGVPLPEKHLNADEFEEVVLMEVMRTTQMLQKAVYRGELGDKHDVTDWLMAMPNIMPRLNDRILSTKSSSYVDMTGESNLRLSAITLEDFSALKATEMTSIMTNSFHYLSTKTEPAIRPLTVWIVADFDTEEGRGLLVEAIKYLHFAHYTHHSLSFHSFYRFVLEPEPLFTDGGELAPGPHARFTSIPESPILTQNYHPPENWLVEVVESLHDLDNIKLESVESGVHSEFELENLLLEGHCFEQSSGNPPRGLQFTLGNNNQPVMVDTIVMANLGYFQLKANPGAWLLKLRHGRSADIYSIASHEGTDTPAGSEDVQVVMGSFKSHVVKLRVAKKPGKQHMQLLSDESDEGSSSDDQDETINIFSVASGHLYERFLRIMMVSVLRHTKAPVKFWFLKNFLSPNFKDALPLLANEYGFEYELVQYKWPRWLHQQSEKQRIIWGYKILFLDVLFPLDIKKIIFVDADQVVRADIKDLNNEDLDGAPYGFVPFCDSRKEIEGFRFWKQGYWHNHLAGRKYHISALFVVDLKRFRQIAAGDRLRGQYQGLSQDPNSLSNLDQRWCVRWVWEVKPRPQHITPHPSTPSELALQLPLAGNEENEIVAIKV